MSNGLVTAHQGMQVNGDFTLASPSATVDGFGDWRVEGQFNWSAGILQSPGLFIAAGGMNISGSAQKSLFGRTLVNVGPATWTGAGAILASSYSSLNNAAGAVFDAQSDATFAAQGAGFSFPAFNNAGTLRKTAGTNTTLNGTYFNNSGLVDVQTGRLTLSIIGPSTNSGAINLAPDTVLSLPTGQLVLEPGSTVTGTGSIEMGNSFLDVNTPIQVQRFIFNNAQLRINSDMQAQQFVMNGGTLTLTGTLTVGESFRWLSGGPMNGPGTLTVQPGALFELSGNTAKAINGVRIQNLGQTLWTGAGGINLGGGSVFNNSSGAVFEAQNDATLAYNFNGAPAPAFSNAGIFRKSSSSNTTTFSFINFTNSGAMELKRGVVNVTGTSGFTQTANGSLSLDLGGLTAGSGFARLTVSGTANLAGTLNVALVNDYLPNLNDTFSVLTYTARSGAFTMLNGLDLGGGLRFQTNYTSTALSLQVVPVP